MESPPSPMDGFMRLPDGRGEERPTPTQGLERSRFDAPGGAFGEG